MITLNITYAIYIRSTLKSINHPRELINVPADCKVCNHPQARDVMLKIYRGELTYVKAAQIMGFDTPTVWRCFREHWKELSTEKGIKLRLKQSTDIDDYVCTLKDTIHIFTERLANAATTDLPFGLQNERALAVLSKESRELMRDILEFEGKLKTGVSIQYNILNIKFTKLTSFLFAELCETDRKKLLERIPDLMESESVGPARKIIENPPSPE